MSVSGRPPRVRPRQLPPDIVQIAPQYRDYEYTVINDEIAIVDARSREVVDIIDDTGAAGGRMASRRDRVEITREQRDPLKQVARRTVGSASSSGSVSDSRCLQLQPMPDELTRNNPELTSTGILRLATRLCWSIPVSRRSVELID
jgi:hypothetical protein